jgi:ankyrin repeat protein
LNVQDSEGNTPFLKYYLNSRFDLSYELLNYGSNINHMNLFGNFALKKAVSGRDFKEIENLVSRGADVNQKDHL